MIFLSNEYEVSAATIDELFFELLRDPDEPFFIPASIFSLRKFEKFYLCI